MFEDQRKAMVEVQLRRRGIKNEDVLSAMEFVPRHKFIPKQSESLSYGDFAVPIGYSQNISQPIIVAQMLELLDPKITDKVLEIGSGSGYVSAVLSRLCNKVIGAELIPELANSSNKVFSELRLNNVKVVAADGSAGLIHHYPYDKILLSAACEKVPEEIFDQLNIGGIVVAPVGTRLKQVLTKFVKTKSGINRSTHGTCVFVPLKGKKGFQ